MKRLFALAGLAAALAWPGAGGAAENGHALPHRSWTFDGLFGTFDHAALQRGSQVYLQVCATCHSLNQLYYRNLGDIGLDKERIKEIAAGVEVTDGPNDQGEMFQRPGKPTDRFKSPFANEQAARVANNGAYPPDLSLVVKARVGGADYLYALLTGYREPPSGMKVEQGMHFNEFFSGGNQQIAMPPPLQEDVVQYADGTKATIEQMAADVTSFLAWAAEPELETRKRIGVKVILFMIVLTGMLYAVKVKIWGDVEHA
jgi:ubiquinol-cytochrome c reductase cytochrome c1 subunit